MKKTNPAARTATVAEAWFVKQPRAADIVAIKLVQVMKKDALMTGSSNAKAMLGLISKSVIMAVTQLLLLMLAKRLNVLMETNSAMGTISRNVLMASGLTLTIVTMAVSSSMKQE